MDKSGIINDSNFGNIAAFQNKAKGKKLLLVAHMDTVQKEGDIVHPQYTERVFKSDGSTILGADNKASIAVLLTLSKYLQTSKNNIVLAFTTREENGLMGSKYFDVKKLNPDYIFNIDGSASVGTIDVQSLGQLAFELYLKGKPAHAATNPEEGINAMLAAAKLLTSVTIGKFKDGTTFNIGIMKSGTGTNVVPFDAYLKGEIRGLTQKKIEKNLQKFRKKIANIAKKTKITYELKIIESNPPFISNTDKNLKIIKQIMENL